MERPFYDTNEDRTNLVPSLQQDAPWVQVPDASAGVELASPPRASWTDGYPNAIGPNPIFDAHHNYYAVDSNILSLGYPSLHSTPFNQGLAPHFASHYFLAETIDGFTPLDDYATDTAYGTTSAAYGATSTANGAGTNTGDLAEGIWPSIDPVSTLMGYDHGITDINPAVYPFLPNPTLAPGPTIPVQARSESVVTNTDCSRPRCSTCNTTFKRASDLARHEKKHQPDRPFKCLVPGCNFKGAYRKDKLDAHIKSCHRRGAA